MKPHGMQLGITTVKDHFANLVCQIPAWYGIGCFQNVIGPPDTGYRKFPSVN